MFFITLIYKKIFFFNNLNLLTCNIYLNNLLFSEIAKLIMFIDLLAFIFLIRSLNARFRISSSNLLN